MTNVSRRRVLLVGGTALLAGCLSESNSDETPAESTDVADDTDDANDGDSDDAKPTDEGGETESQPTEELLSGELETLLGTIPDEVDGHESGMLWVVAPNPETERSPTTGFFEGFEDDLGIGPEQIDRMAATMYGSYERSLAVILGSFERGDVDAADEFAAHAEDGFAVAAFLDDEPWEPAVDAAVEQAEGSASGVLDDDLEAMVRPLQDSELIVVMTDPHGEQSFEDIDESVEMYAYAQDLLDDLTEEVVGTVLFEDSDAADEDELEHIMDMQGLTPGDLDVKFVADGRIGIGAGIQDIPSFRLPDESPEAQFTLRNDGTVLEQTGSEPVDPARLELQVDQEVRDAPWSDREEPIEPGERFDIDFEPFSLVEIYWNDPAHDGVSQPLGQDVVASQNAFTGEYDAETDELTVTYTGEPDTDAERLEVSRRTSRSVSPSDIVPLTEFVGETLESGTEFVVEDVEYGTGITISVSLEDEVSWAGNVFDFFAEPPGRFRFESTEDGVAIEYHGDEIAADNYEVLFNNETAEEQFTDSHEQLTEGDRIELAAEIGDRIHIEWVASEEPVWVGSHTVSPDVRFDIEYDEDDNEITITHEEGVTVDAGELGIALNLSDGFDQRDWPEKGTVSEGNSVTLELDEDESPLSVSIVFGENDVLASEFFDQ